RPEEHLASGLVANDEVVLLARVERKTQGQRSGVANREPRLHDGCGVSGINETVDREREGKIRPGQQEAVEAGVREVPLSRAGECSFDPSHQADAGSEGFFRRAGIGADPRHVPYGQAWRPVAAGQQYVGVAARDYRFTRAKALGLPSGAPKRIPELLRTASG